MTDSFREYLADYDYKGERWSLSVMAESHDDARRRLQFAGANAEIVGYVKGEIPTGTYFRRLKPFFLGAASFCVADIAAKAMHEGLWWLGGALFLFACVIVWSGILSAEKNA